MNLIFVGTHTMGTRTLRIFLIFLCAIAIALSSVWFFQSRKIEKNVVGWLNDKNSNRITTFRNISISGYPNRIDITIDQLEIFLANFEVTLKVRLIQLFKVIYQPSLNIIAIGTPLEFSTGNSTFVINSEPIMASRYERKNKPLTETIIETNQIKISTKKSELFAIDHLLFSAKANNSNKNSPTNTYLALKNISLTGLSDILSSNKTGMQNRIERIILDSTIIPNSNYSGTNVKMPSTQARINQLEIIWGPVECKLAGNLTLNYLGQLTGSLDLSLRNWRQTLEYFVKTGFVSKENATLLTAGLTMIEGVNKNTEFKIPLKIEKNVLFIGPVRVLVLPTFRSI